MRGLIYKELYLSRKQWIMGGALIAGFILLELLVMFSFRYGNLADISGKESSVDVCFTLFSILVCIAAYAVFESDNGGIEADFKAKWNLYGYTLPVSEYKLAAVKTGKIAAGFLTGTAISLLNYLVLLGVTGRGFEKVYIYASLAIGLIFLLVACIVIPLTYRFKNEKISYGILAIVYAAVMWGISSYMADFQKKFTEAHPDMDEFASDEEMFRALAADMKAFTAHWGWALPLMISAVIAVSYLFTVRMIRKRVM